MYTFYLKNFSIEVIDGEIGKLPRKVGGGTIFDEQRNEKKKGLEIKIRHTIAHWIDSWDPVVS